MATRKTPAKKAAAPKKVAAKPARRPGTPQLRTDVEGYDIVLFVPDDKKTAQVQRMIDELNLRPVMIALAKAYVSP